jgi:hypothetical protein
VGIADSAYTAESETNIKTEFVENADNSSIAPDITVEHKVLMFIFSGIHHTTVCFKLLPYKSRLYPDCFITLSFHCFILKPHCFILNLLFQD